MSLHEDGWTMSRGTRIALAFICLASLALIVGCTALPGDNVLTIKQTDLNVHWKMTQYNAMGPFGGVTAAQRQAVDAANKDYQEALDQAVKEAHGNRDAPTPPYLQQKASQLIQVLTSVLSTLTWNSSVPGACVLGCTAPAGERLTTKNTKTSKELPDLCDLCVLCGLKKSV